jgi:hypothetical protein
MGCASGPPKGAPRPYGRRLGRTREASEGSSTVGQGQARRRPKDFPVATSGRGA